MILCLHKELASTSNDGIMAVPFHWKISSPASRINTSPLLRESHVRDTSVTRTVFAPLRCKSRGRYSSGPTWLKPESTPPTKLWISKPLNVSHTLQYLQSIWKVRQEQRGLKAFNFTVLNRRSAWLSFSRKLSRGRETHLASRQAPQFYKQPFQLRLVWCALQARSERPSGRHFLASWFSAQWNCRRCKRFRNQLEAKQQLGIFRFSKFEVPQLDQHLPILPLLF